jgi:hypothetical protein
MRVMVVGVGGGGGWIGGVWWWLVAGAMVVVVTVWWWWTWRAGQDILRRIMCYAAVSGRHSTTVVHIIDSIAM